LQPCNSFPWELAFRFDFKNEEGFNNFFINIPLASFAVDNHTDDTCTLYVQNLGTDDDEPIVLGTMFMQNFIAYYENDYNKNTESLTLMRSREFAMPQTTIGQDITPSDVSPFNNTINPTVLNIVVDETMTPMIKASASFQGIAGFKFSLTSSNITAYESSCSQCEAMFQATPYFDTTGYIDQSYGAYQS
jgi:hypothetical protein